MNSDRVTALIFLAFSVAYGAMAQTIELYVGWEEEAFTARTFPTALAWAGAIVSLLMLVVPSEGSRALSLSALRRYDWWRVVLLCVLMVAYGLTIQSVGFFLSTSLFLVIGYLILGERRWWVILVASVPVALFFMLVLNALGIYVVDPTLSALGLVR